MYITFKYRENFIVWDAYISDQTIKKSKEIKVIKARCMRTEGLIWRHMLKATDSSNNLFFTWAEVI